MKILIKILVLFILCGVIFWIFRSAYYEYALVCEEPLSYRIAAIDERFDISEDEVLGIVREAEALWEDPLGIDLFVYRSDADLEVEFIFDERQENTIKALELEKDLAVKIVEKDSLEQDFKSLENTYQVQLQRYESLRGSYQEDLDKYNREVNKWNSRGGAPEDVVDDLDDDRKDLKKDFDVLESQRIKLNQIVASSQGAVNELNNSVQDINQDVDIYNNLFDEGIPFEQGVFNSDDGIKIYQYRGQNDLRAVLAHEIGHARGVLEHVDAPEAVMHYLMKDQDLTNLAMHPEDIAAMQEVCRQKTVKEFFMHLRANWKEFFARFGVSAAERLKLL